jgi:hypothetical protein
MPDSIPGIKAGSAAINGMTMFLGINIRKINFKTKLVYL